MRGAGEQTTVALYMLIGYGRTEVGVQLVLAIHVGYVSDTPLSVFIHPLEFDPIYTSQSWCGWVGN